MQSCFQISAATFRAYRYAKTWPGTPASKNRVSARPTGSLHLLGPFYIRPSATHRTWYGNMVVDVPVRFLFNTNDVILIKMFLGPARIPLMVYGGHLMLNLSWTHIFFSMHKLKLVSKIYLPKFTQVFIFVLWM